MSRAIRDFTLALAKGKLLPPAVEWLSRVGYTFGEDLPRSRKLRVPAREGGVTVLLVKPDDVPIYVEYGIADAGIVGYDVLRESGADVFQPRALNFGHCKMVVAGRPDDDYQRFPFRSLVRVGTKYPNIAREHFQNSGIQADIIALRGSVELSVTAGLADVIVDIVETGTTLKQNGLVVHEELFPSSARLIVNKASHKLKLDLIDRLLSVQ